MKNDKKFLSYPTYKLQKIKLKSKIKSIRQRHKTRYNKSRLNTVTKEVKQLIRSHCNVEFRDYITKLSPNEDMNYSLWKAAKRLKRKTIVQLPIKKKIPTGLGVHLKKQTSSLNIYKIHSNQTQAAPQYLFPTRFRN